MLSPDDLIQLPYTSDLTPAGVAYACQTLPLPACRNISETMRNLRQMVAQQAAELAFRRHLTTLHIPYKLCFESQFARPSRVSAVIGGRNCSLYNSQIFKRDDIRRIHQDPACLLSSPAAIPSTGLSQEIHSETDLLVFSFVTGLVTPSQAEITKVISARKSVYLLYPLPAAWSNPSRWDSLGNVVLKSESDTIISVTLGGYSQKHDFVSEEVILPPGQRVHAQQNYYCLSYLHTSHIPAKRLGLRCPSVDNTLVIQPYQWGNIWIYGMRIILAGWITRGEFRRCAHPYSNGTYAFRSKGTNSKYFGVPISQLYSLKELFVRALNWG
jgi:hypothetical protein